MEDVANLLTPGWISLPMYKVVIDYFPRTTLNLHKTYLVIIKEFVMIGKQHQNFSNWKTDNFNGVVGDKL